MVTSDVSPDVERPALAPAPAPQGSPRPSTARRRVRTALAALGLVALVAVPVAARQSAVEARREATEARARAAAAVARRTRAEARVEAARPPLASSFVEAGEATAARDVQRARLVELQLAEDTLEEVVDEARRATEAVEAEQQGVGAEVQQQAVDLPQMEGCLAAIRPLVDAAFLATVHPGVEVPDISPACRTLLSVVEGAGG